jgi:hypothetical protein
MPDHEPCGAEIIQLERALSKLVKAAEAYMAPGWTKDELTPLKDAIENAKAHLS